MPEASAERDSSPFDAGSTTTFCSDVDAAFCADFDQDASGPFKRWVMKGGATLEQTFSDSVSKPASLWIRLPAADGGYETNAFASAIVDVSSSQHRTVEVEVALRADKPSTGKVQLLTVSLNGSGNGGVALAQKDGLWGLNMSVKGASGTFYPSTSDAGLSSIELSFTKLRLEVHFANDTTGYAQLYGDDVLLVESPSQQTTTELMTNAIEVQLMAASATGPTPPTQAKYDNVVIRTRP